MDRSDITRKAYLAAVLDFMQDSREETRVRQNAQHLLQKKVALGLIGEDHAQRWTWLLTLPLSDLQEHLLKDDEGGRELRHAHILAGMLPAKEANQIRKAALAAILE